MKIVFLYSFSLLSILAYPQKETYLELDANTRIIAEDIGAGFFHIVMTINQPNSPMNFDNYTFFINTPSNKVFGECGEEIETREFITVSDLQKIPPCELHEFLSSQRNVYFIKANPNGKFFRWPAMYEGTSKNIIISKLGKL